MDNDFFKGLKESFESLPILEVKNVLGEPIKVLDDTTVFPIVKLSAGTVGGGIDNEKKKKKNFVGATTFGVSVEPLGFLIVRKNEQQILTLCSHNAFSDISKTMANAMSYFIKKSGKAKLKKEKENLKNAKK